MGAGEQQQQPQKQHQPPQQQQQQQEQQSQQQQQQQQQPQKPQKQQQQLQPGQSWPLSSCSTVPPESTQLSGSKDSRAPEEASKEPAGGRERGAASGRATGALLGEGGRGAPRVALFWVRWEGRVARGALCWARWEGRGASGSVWGPRRDPSKGQKGGHGGTRALASLLEESPHVAASATPARPRGAPQGVVRPQPVRLVRSTRDNHGGTTHRDAADVSPPSEPAPGAPLGTPRGTQRAGLSLHAGAHSSTGGKGPTLGQVQGRAGVPGGPLLVYRRDRGGVRWPGSAARGAGRAGTGAERSRSLSLPRPLRVSDDEGKRRRSGGRQQVLLSGVNGGAAVGEVRWAQRGRGK